MFGIGVDGKKRKARVRDEIPEEVDYDDEEVKESLGASSSSSQKSLYETLGVDKAATQQEIKKAYYKLALRLHPDKNPDDEEAKEKFQKLQKVISILGNEEKRAVYDQTGCVDDADLAGDAIQNLKTFFRTMYRKISESDIEEFEANYRGSDSEKKDLLKLFKESKGNMDRLFCCMLCSDAKLDSHRFKDIIDEAISAGKIESTKAYKRWAKQVSKTEPPTGPLRPRKKSKESSEDLYAMIAQRQNERRSKVDTMFSNLVHKYGGGEAAPEPSEEEFEAARKNSTSGRNRSKNSASFWHPLYHASTCVKS